MKNKTMMVSIPDRRKHTGKRRGFTLLEIIAVLIILGLITVTAMMVMDDTDYNLLSQAQAIRQNIRYAQSMAMKTGTMWGVRSDAASYWAFEGDVNTVRTFPGQETPVVLTDIGVSLVDFIVYFNGFGQPAVPDAEGYAPATQPQTVKVGPAGWDFNDPTEPPQLVSFQILPDTGYIEVLE